MPGPLATFGKMSFTEDEHCMLLEGINHTEKDREVQKPSKRSLGKIASGRNQTIKSHWKNLINDISPTLLLNELVKCEILNMDNFKNLNTKRRSHQVRVLLTATMKIMQTDEDYKKFEQILIRISAYCAENLSKPVKPQACLIVIPSEIERLQIILKHHMPELEKKLCFPQFFEIVDDFVEDFIFDFEVVEKMIDDDVANMEVVKYFLDNVYSTIERGSLNCFLRSVKRNNQRFGKFLMDLGTVLEKKLQADLKNIVSSSEHQKEMYVKLIEETTILPENEKRDATELTLKLTGPSEVDLRIYSNIRHNPQLLEPEAAMLKSFVKSSEKGSVVIRLKSLDESNIAALSKELIYSFIEKCLQKLYKDIDISPQITITVEVTLFVETSGNDTSYVPPIFQPKLNQVILANRNFLIEEMEETDLITLAKEFGISFLNSTDGKGCYRQAKAAELVATIISMNIPDDRLLQILETSNRSPLFQRLKTSKKAYESYTPLLKKQIIDSMSTIAAELDFDTLRDIFTNREVLSESLFDIVQDKVPKKEQTTVILSEILKNGPIAMVTLVDVLFMKNLDLLAQSLCITNAEHSAEDTTSGRNVSIKSVSPINRKLLFKGIYEIKKEKSVVCTNYSEMTPKHKNDTDSDPNMLNLDPGVIEMSLCISDEVKDNLLSGDNERSSILINDLDTMSKHKDDNTERGSTQLSIERPNDDEKVLLNSADIERRSILINDLDSKSKQKEDTETDPILENTETGSTQLSMKRTDDDEDVLLNSGDNKKSSILINDLDSKSKHKDDTEIDRILENTETGSTQLSMERTDADEEVILNSDLQNKRKPNDKDIAAQTVISKDVPKLKLGCYGTGKSDVGLLQKVVTDFTKSEHQRKPNDSKYIVGLKVNSKDVPTLLLRSYGRSKSDYDRKKKVTDSTGRKSDPCTQSDNTAESNFRTHNIQPLIH